MRAGSTRRRLMSPGVPSPKAKRLGSYVQPGPVDTSQPMDAASMQAEVMQTKRAVEAIHQG